MSYNTSSEKKVVRNEKIYIRTDSVLKVMVAMPRLLGFRNCFCVFRSPGVSGAPAHPEPNIRGGPALKEYLSALRGVKIRPKISGVQTPPLVPLVM